MMRSTILLLALSVAAIAAQSQDPTRPFPNHERPPEGWFCVPGRDNAEVEKDAHACACRGTMLAPVCHKQEPGDDGTLQDVPLGDTEMSNCKAYCHKDHCHCLNSCKDS